MNGKSPIEQLSVSRKNRSVTLVGEADRKLLKAAIKHASGEDQVRHRQIPSEAVAKWSKKLEDLKDEAGRWVCGAEAGVEGEVEAEATEGRSAWLLIGKAGLRSEALGSRFMKKEEIEDCRTDNCQSTAPVFEHRIKWQG